MSEHTLTDRKGSFAEELGFRVEEWADGHGRLVLPLQKWHLNGSGVVHGGVLMTMLDLTSGMTGLYCTVKGHRRYSMTVSLTTHFIGQTRTGKLIGIGKRTRTGSKLFFSTAEVRTEEGSLVATASAVHRYRTGSEKPEGVPKRRS
jgi:uncharacterized protein (TIGR00369 family)